MNRPLASVTGAGGGIGARLCAALAGTHRVRGLFRAESGRSRALAAAGGEIVIGDLADEAMLASLVSGADVVFHCAAKISGFSPAEFEAVNVEGTRAVVLAARAAGCRRVVHVSSIAAYGSRPPLPQGYAEEILIEEGPELDAYSRTKAASERVVREALAGSATTWTIVRPTCVFGPGIASWTTTPLKLIAKGRPLIFGLDGGGGRLNIVHVDDLVRGMIAAAGAEPAAGEIFNLGGEEVTYREFYEALGALVNKAPVYAASKATRGFGELARRLGGVVQPAAEMSRGIGMALRMSANQAAYPSAKAKACFGYAPQIGLGEGLLSLETSQPRRERVLWNCDRHFAIRPSAGVEPGSVGELSRVLRQRGGRRIKAIGSLHSFAPVPSTEGLIVSLRRMRRVLSVEGTLVTVEGGATLSDLNRELARYGLALPTHGSFVAQTIAGAIATGTHGGALKLGTLADYVEALEIVRADGERVTLRKGEADFDGAVVSLGLLGVTASVSIRCVPEFYLRAETETMPFPNFLARFPELQEQNEFTDARWFPQIGMVEVMGMSRIPRPQTSSVATSTRPPSAAQRRMVSNVFKTVLRGISASGSAKWNASFVRKLLGTTYKARVGRCDDLLAFTDLSQGEPFPIDDLEFAIPYGVTVEALSALEAHFRRGGKMPVVFPLHLRCSAVGSQWLGANYGQAVSWLELWHYPAAPDFYAEIVKVLGPFTPRYHFGKILPRTGDSEGVPPLNLPRLADFLALRERWDPTGALLNSYVARLLGVSFTVG